MGLALSLSSCIGDDFVMDTIDAVLRITSTVDTLAKDSSYQFGHLYLNNVGNQEPVDATWSSSDASVISITPQGLATGIDSGSAHISVLYDDAGLMLSDSVLVHVGERTVVSSPPVRTGTVQTTSTYLLEGDFTLSEDGPNIVLEFTDNYRASTALPGLYVYLSNNAATVANALEIGAVQVFNGAHSYTIPGVTIDEYRYVLYFCKPFNVKVGDGEIM